MRRFPRHGALALLLATLPLTGCSFLLEAPSSTPSPTESSRSASPVTASPTQTALHTATPSPLSIETDPQALAIRRTTGLNGDTDVLRQAEEGLEYVVQITCSGTGRVDWTALVDDHSVASGSVTCPAEVTNSLFTAKGGEFVRISAAPVEGMNSVVQVAPIREG